MRNVRNSLSGLKGSDDDDRCDKTMYRETAAIIATKEQTMTCKHCKLVYECYRVFARFDVPLGCAKSPFSTPDLIALLNWVSKTASEDARFL